jgi:hypothetical protein
MTSLRSRTWITVLGLIALAAGSAAADPGKPNRGRPHQTVPTGADDAAGATTDAAAEAELEQMTSRSSAGLTPIVRADGTIEVDLEGRFMSVAVAAPDGKAHCHDTRAGVRGARARQAARPGTKAARRATRGAKPAPAPVAAPAPFALEVM